MATSRMLFVNMAVEDLERTVDFFTALGFAFDPRFTDESTTCMIISDQACAMLMTKARFQDFTSKQLCDAPTHAEALFALSCDSREEVEQLVATALANGGKPAEEPQDLGFMYGHSFQDPDGHVWEVLWMDPAALEG